MGVRSYGKLAEFELDVLKEVGNIGSGHAATALSTLLNRPVDMAVPKVSLVPFEEVAERAGGAEQLVVAVFLRVDGDAPGNLFYIMNPVAAKRLLRRLAAMEVEEDLEYSEMELSALSEIGNILAGSYLSSLADLTRLALSPSVPAVALDMAGAVLAYGLMQYGEMGDAALLVETRFQGDGEEIEGQFFLIPDPDSFPTLFRSLGVDVP
ncbi:chemotaxis protein CheC [Paenibacillus sp. FSL W8-1187]|uniref:chemotaxis protein CheC n=1 Tax=Paenibacillus sp. FSL W8-1187 TaxID=2975339 RepID=UPI0005BCD9E5|nr:MULTISPECIES: chemotaxis protein CheC [Paenibacillus]QGG58772.1 CheY-P-specific phosphatase CheC [Paenibacillus sp. B01]